MEALSYVVRTAIPSYLSHVPIPSSFKGFLDLSFKDWIHLTSFSIAIGGISYIAAKPYYDKYYGEQIPHPINFHINKDKQKAYDIVDIEDLGEKTNFCRCWQSKKFPFCDGSHNKFNAATGDNIASLIMERKPRSG